MNRLIRSKLPIAFVSMALASSVVACGSDDSGATSDKSTEVVAASYGGVAAATSKKYMYPGLKKDTGLSVKSIAVDSGFTARLEAQKNAGKMQWDVIEGVDGATAAQLDKMGLLEHIPAKLKGEIEAVSLPETVSDYGVARGDTGVVVVCNMDKVKKCPTSMAEFWDVDDFPGRRAVMDYPQEVPVAALVADGVTQQDMYPLDVDRAFKKLEELAPSVNVWTTSGDQQIQVMRDGQVSMSLMWNGRAKTLKDEGANLKVVWDGSLLDPNYMVVIKDGPNGTNGMDYLKWYAMHPKAQANSARALPYGSNHKEVIPMLSSAEAAQMPMSPENSKTQVRIDPEWWVKDDNAATIGKLWKELLAG